jgi:NADH-quinone oxidoreductase subunit M
MILVWFILLPFLGGILAWYAGQRNAEASRWISASVLSLGLVLALVVWFLYSGAAGSAAEGTWLIDFERQWMPQLGIAFHLGLDGLSLLLVILTLFLGLMSVISSWREIHDRVGFFHMNLLWTLSGVLGVFLSLDLFLFYFFWELMLLPMYFLIAIWGHENRAYASMKFFIFTQLSGLLMFLAILSLYFIHASSTGTYTFDYAHLLGMSLPLPVSIWLMLGFFMAFAVKLPVVPFHTWLPDAHTEAPTAGSIILAGLLLKTGAYGMIRFMVPLFPEATAFFAPTGMVLGVAGILYGAFLAFSQKDLKRLIAYTSVSHMGFVLLGVFAWNELALQGTVLQMVCHGISTGGLFILAGALQERLRTRDIEQMGGIWSSAPKMGGLAMVFAMASLGLPGLGNFAAEFLVLISVFRKNMAIAAIATAGLVAATVYALQMLQKVFFGKQREELKPADVSVREMSVATVLIAALLFLGLYPQPVLNTAAPALRSIRTGVGTHDKNLGHLTGQNRAGRKGVDSP